jgi:hypothetical protein
MQICAAPQMCISPRGNTAPLLAWNLAGTSPHRVGITSLAVQHSGAAAEACEALKRVHLGMVADCSAQGFAFIPLVFEPSGGWGPAAICAFKTMARAVAARTGQERNKVMTEHLQKFCVVIRKARACAVFHRDPWNSVVLVSKFQLALEALAPLQHG